MARKRFRIKTNSCTLEAHREDCIEALANPKRVKPGTVDVVVTSPPYNLGIPYSRYDDTVPRDEYLAWLSEWADLVREAMSEDGSLFLNVGSKPSDPMVPFEVLQVMKDHGFHLQNTFHWIKSIAIGKESMGQNQTVSEDIVVGHYKPINSPRFVNDCHEYIFHLTRTGKVPVDRLALGVPYQDKSNVQRWKGAGTGLHCRGNTWFIPYKTICNHSKDRPHPATFPVQLPEMCLKLHGVDKVRKVMDPFLGLGNTAVACAHLGLDFIGFEIDPSYHAQAVRAIESACNHSSDNGRHG